MIEKANLYYVFFLAIILIAGLASYSCDTPSNNQNRLAGDYREKLPAVLKQSNAESITQWERKELGDHAWSGYTISVPTDKEIFFLHGKDVEVLHQNGRWARWKNVLPNKVGPFSDATWDFATGIIVMVGRERPGFRFDFINKKSTTVDALKLPSIRGTKIVCDSSGTIYCASGGLGNRTFGRVREGSWESLEKSTTVNSLGRYSAGLFRLGDTKLLAFGDHHIGAFNLEEQHWDENRAYIVMGLRPALDRGGMVSQDPDTYDIYVTLGKSSRSLGVTDVSMRRFFHLKPRLPFLLNEAGRTLYISHHPEGKRLNLLSLEQQAIYSIPLNKLQRIGVDDRLADNQSRWEVWNTNPRGAHGELVRERDSYCNIVFVEPHLYIQRKDLVRQMNIQTMGHSENGAGYRYGKQFIAKGAGLASDGKERLYINNGHDWNFWALELNRRADGKPSKSGKRLEIKEMAVRKLAALPEKPDGNTAITYYRGALYALYQPVTRIVYRYDIERNRWTPQTLVPNKVPYTTEDGVDLLVHGEDLVLLSGGWMAKYRPETGWSKPTKLSFTHTADGGMAAVDNRANIIYVAIGGGSRDLGMITLMDGGSEILPDFFPDVVSVHGRRMMVIDEDDGRYLYIYRGHDTNELWRIAIPDLHNIVQNR